MTTDLKLSVVDNSTVPPTVDTRRLSWATSLFYFGMLGGLYPMTFALQRFDMGRILGVVVILWSAICMLTAAVTSWQGLFVQRFFLGFVESIIPTGFMCIVSSYYTQSEQSLRQSWWFSSTGLFTIIGGALNYGFAQITGGGLKRWQYIYLFGGALTFFFGLFCFALPNSPVSAWFLTAEERFAAVERLRYGQTGVRCTKFKSSQLKEALLDIKVYLIFIMMASAYTVNGAVSGFGPLIVSTFGWNTLQSILFQFPLGGLCFIVILATGYIGSKVNNVRIFMLIFTCLPVIAGCAIIWKSTWSHHAAAPIVGYSITGFFGGTVSLIITIGMANVAGHTKKSFMAATIFVAYCVGNIVGPQLIWSQTKTRHYPALWLGLIIWYDDLAEVMGMFIKQLANMLCTVTLFASLRRPHCTLSYELRTRRRWPCLKMKLSEQSLLSRTSQTRRIHTSATSTKTKSARNWRMLRRLSYRNDTRRLALPP